MASPKTRANMARVAAAAIFAAGASLAVVGTASASNTDKSSEAKQAETLGGTLAGVVEGSEGAIVGVVEGTSGGQTDGGDILGAIEGGDVVGAVEGGDVEGSVGGDVEGDVGGDVEGDVGGDVEGDVEGDVGGGDDGGTVDGGDIGGGDVGGGDVGGGDDGGTSGGPEGVNEGATSEGATGGGNEPSPDTQGGGGAIEQDDPDEDLTDVPPAETSPNGDQGELAETGSSTNETLLIIGAATMIAGGVAFRYLPRLINKGVTAA